MAAGFVALPALTALEARDASAGRTAHVRSEAQFAAAAERFRWSGGTIVLLGARYDHLRVGPRGTKRLTVRATRKASTGLVTLDRTRSVRLVGLRLVPRGGPAGVRAHGVRNVRLERIALSGGLSGHEASVVLHGSTGVTITKSRFSRCGDKAVCVLTGGSSHVRILDSRFRDCYGCDFVRGNFGRRLVIRGNRFDRSLVGPCGTNPDLCNHQDLVQIHNGTGLLVERNRFGVYEPPGGGQVALFGGVSDVMIRNNLFLRSDPRVPGLVAHVGVNLGGHAANPKRVVITHNTILSGRRHWRGHATSIRIKPSLARMPLRNRPVIANNVIRLMRTPRFFCRGARLTVGNLIEHGTSCSPADVVGPARLNAAGEPTADSTNVIGRGVRRWATRYDMHGVRRDAEPDAGAFEFVPPPP